MHINRKGETNMVAKTRKKQEHTHPVFSRYNLRIHGGNMLFMLPALIIYIAVVLIPFFQGIPYSLTNWKSIISDKMIFVGLKNYTTLLTNKYFLDTFLNTFKFTAIYLLGANILGLFLAMILWRSSRFNNIVRTVMFMPFTVSLVGAAIVWSYVYTDIISSLFEVMSPLGCSSQVIGGMAVIAIWRDMGYCMLIYIAGLQSIPTEYYEAARVDGASSFQRIKHITLPLLIPAFTSNITLLLAWGLKVFDYPMAVARNMEAAKTTTMYVYDNIFGFSKAGLGQAAAIITTVVLLILTTAVSRMFRKLEVEA
jgi:ABC-type sugar transport system permease subunit